jgi:hypothetical protein
MIYKYIQVYPWCEDSRWLRPLSLVTVTARVAAAAAGHWHHRDRANSDAAVTVGVCHLSLRRWQPESWWPLSIYADTRYLRVGVWIGPWR